MVNMTTTVINNSCWRMTQVGLNCFLHPFQSISLYFMKFFYSQYRCCIPESQGLTANQQQWKEELPFTRKKPVAGPGSSGRTTLFIKSWPGFRGRIHKRQNHQIRLQLGSSSFVQPHLSHGPISPWTLLPGFSFQRLWWATLIRWLISRP